MKSPNITLDYFARAQGARFNAWASSATAGSKHFVGAFALSSSQAQALIVSTWSRLTPEVRMPLLFVGVGVSAPQIVC
jgi:hypothetical protein